MYKYSFLVLSLILFNISNRYVVLSAPVKIINGYDAKLEDAPYMVQLRVNNGDFICGGSIIASNWILTAAHCLENDKIYGVVYGDLKLQEGDKNWPNNSVKVKRGIQHPSFNHDTEISHDIALLELETLIPFSKNVQAVTLPNSDQVPFHVEGLLTGWGSEVLIGPATQTLKKLQLELLSDEECEERLNIYGGEEDGFESSEHLCTDDRNNGHCYGDSGGPYVINGVQYGVVSWAYDPCASYPGVYSRVSSPEHLQWIKETMGHNNFVF